MKVMLEYNPSIYHSMQIITGYKIMENKGYLELNLIENKKLHPAIIKSNINNNNNNNIVIYDLRDYSAIDEKLLKNSIVYYKRSFDGKIHNYISEKIKPLGFNYMVGYNYSLKDKTKNLIRRLLGKEHNFYNYYEFEELPKLNDEVKILFLTRFWDTNFEGIDDKQKKEFESINNFRKECIIKAREEFGNRILAGVNDSLFSRKYCKELIVDNSITNKGNFINLIKEYPICVSTMGLHKSNGWRIAEYIAASRAIVSEKLYYEVPGNFEVNKNYLQFSTADELVEKLNFLIKNTDKIANIMNENNIYYNKYLRPDKLVFNTIKQFM